MELSVWYLMIFALMNILQRSSGHVSDYSSSKEGGDSLVKLTTMSSRPNRSTLPVLSPQKVSPEQQLQLQANSKMLRGAIHLRHVHHHHHHHHKSSQQAAASAKIDASTTSLATEHSRSVQRHEAQQDIREEIFHADYKSPRTHPPQGH